MTSEDPSVTNPSAQAAVVDLLAVLAYGELSGFERTAADASLALTIRDKDLLAGMATAEYRHYCRLRDRLVEMGVDPEEAMEPFRRAYDEDGMSAAEFDAFGATARTLRVFCEHYSELLGIVRDAMVPNPDKKK